MRFRSSQRSLGVLASFLSAASLALAQAPSIDDDAMPSSRRPANFASSSLSTEGDAPANASDGPAFDMGCCDPCACSRWTVTVGAIFLDRSPARVTLVQTQAGSKELLNASDFNFNWAPGPRLSLFRHQDDFDLELTHFDVTGWWARTQVTVPPALKFSDGSGSILSVGGNGDFVNFLSTSRLFSTEFNVRKAWTPNITALAGLRWVEFYDHLQVYPSFTTFTYDTVNRLYGAQIGFDASLLDRNRFELRSLLKAGIYGNAAQNFNGNLFNFPNATHTASQVAFLGDLAINGTYRLSGYWAVRGGYQLLWMDGLALAPNQVRVSHTLNPAINTVDTTNALFAHGATVGLEANF